METAMLNPARGFEPVHQKVSLDIDFEKRIIKGTSKLLINVRRQYFPCIRLHCSQLDIVAVKIEDQRLDVSESVVYADPLDLTQIKGVDEINDHHQLHDHLITHTPGIKDYHGSLIIWVPQALQDSISQQFDDIHHNQHKQHLENNREANTDEEKKVDVDNVTPQILLNLEIEYLLTEPKTGIQFSACPSPATTKSDSAFSDVEFPYLFTQNYPLLGSSSCWIPCVDNLIDQPTWEIEFIYPRSVKVSELDSTSYPFTAVCSGDLQEEKVHPQNSSKLVSKFLLNFPCAPQSIAFAIGIFKMINLSEFRELEETEVLASSDVKLRAYASPFLASELENTCSFLYRALDFFVREYGSFPFSSFSVCFVDDLICDSISGANLALLHSRLLYPNDIIDTMLEVTHRISLTLAQQWFGVTIRPKKFHDLWLILGLSQHMTNQFMRVLAGKNYHLFRMKRNIQQLCELDQNQLPLYSNFLPATDTERLTFMEFKAAVVLFILDRRMSRLGNNFGLSRIIPKIILEHVRGDLPHDLLSTNHFFRVCEKISFINLSSFIDEWIKGSGFPVFRISHSYNRKKMVIEILIRQMQSSQPPPNLTTESFVEEANNVIEHIHNYPPRHKFTGPMTIRIFESDGSSLDHVVDIRDAVTKVEVSYNVKSKRGRTRIVDQFGSNAIAAPQSDILEVSGNDESKKFGTVLLEPDEISEWHISDWTAEDEDNMLIEAYEWLRMDADMEWIGIFKVSQSPSMSVAQLQREPEVTAQFDAIKCLIGHELSQPSEIVSSYLLKTLMDERYYYGIRQMAAAGLVKCALKSLNYIGLFHLFQYARKMYCHEDSSITCNFSNLVQKTQEYYVMQTVIRSLSEIRTSNGQCPEQVKTFVLNMLQYHDNSSHPGISDTFFLCTVFQALTRILTGEFDTSRSILNLATGNNAITFVPTNSELSNPLYVDDDAEFIFAVRSELERHLQLSKYIPSYRNLITITILECQRSLVSSGVFKPDIRQDMLLAHPTNDKELRLAAMRSLLLSRENWYELEVFLIFLLKLIRNDESAWFRRQIAHVLHEYIGRQALLDPGSGGSNRAQEAELIIIGTADTTAKPYSSGANGLNKQIEPSIMRKNLEKRIQKLRLNVSHNDMLKELFLSLLLDRKVEFTTKMDILQVINILYEPHDKYIVTLKSQKLLRYWKDLTNNTPRKPIEPVQARFVKESGIIIFTGQRIQEFMYAMSLNNDNEKSTPTSKVSLSSSSKRVLKIPQNQMKTSKKPSKAAPNNANSKSPAPPKIKITIGRK